MTKTLLLHSTLLVGAILVSAAVAVAADNTPPPGFVALFNGRDLNGWKGLVANPVVRAKMVPDALAPEQQAADTLMRDHWHVQDGALVFDGKGQSICTAHTTATSNCSST